VAGLEGAARAVEVQGVHSTYSPSQRALPAPEGLVGLGGSMFSPGSGYS
jgi:hypothetical protein